MTKTILITGATDGIGLLTAKKLAAQGHQLWVHGRNASKLQQVAQTLFELGAGVVETYVADFSDLDQVKALAGELNQCHSRLDVVINNAGVYKTSQPLNSKAQDIRFVVNTLAPYLLTQSLLPLMSSDGRVVNVVSAAQAPVNVKALLGEVHLQDDFSAYAQSKLALTIWSRQMAHELQGNGPAIIAVNPGSLLASKMVREGFGVAGHDLAKGADILIKAALGDSFSQASGLYFDNDQGDFSPPHNDALDERKSFLVIAALQKVLNQG
ncbi:SDR family NAD(P)-dependent oxidoreductase [Gilvimarinus chinensis]|uniref:SDR family NAD(P)-dependent oxidoreductase n=1 Tax=Gilvimarinus chinensis TaxID=396005 RepID=UPI00036248A4|nr:SDR family NAD(P)-dependent oxidoreductase [Gilvimarinus chinensis]